MIKTGSTMAQTYWVHSESNTLRSP